MRIDKRFITTFSQNKYLKSLPSFKEEHTQAVTTIALTLLSLAFFGLFAIAPTIATILELRKEKDDDTFVNQRLDEKITNLGALQQKYNQLLSDFSFVDAAMPTTPKTPLFLDQVQTIAQKNNMTTTRLQTFQVDLFPLTKGQKNAQTVGFSFDGQGTYTDIVKFIASITSFERIATIDSITLTKPSEETTGLRVNMQGTIYFKN